jgi:hypothetical protein
MFRNLDHHTFGIDLGIDIRPSRPQKAELDLLFFERHRQEDADNV